MLEQVAKQSEGERWSQWVAMLSEAYLLSGRRDEALTLAERGLKISDVRQRSFHAWLLQLLGEIAAHRDPPEAERAEHFYHEDLALATELGMRRLAADLYRAMEMTFWLPQVESAVPP